MSAETIDDRLLDALGRVPLFRGLPRPDLERIGQLVQPRHARPGEFLFREGDPGDRLYIVEEGAVEVLKERPLGDHERLAVKRAGETLGELALLSQAPRTASVRAVEPTRVLAVTRADFDRLLGDDTLAVRILRGLARALRALDVRVASGQAGASGESIPPFGRDILDGLEPREPPQAEGFSIAGATARDEEGPGASLWDGFTTEDGRAVLAVFDVKGTGLPPAYLISVIRAVLHEVGPTEEFGRLLRRLNATTFRNLFEGVDECVEAALIEVRNGRVRWSCAGDQPGVILRADGAVEKTPSHGPPLGILPQFEYASEELALGSGDTLITFSEAPAGLVKGAVELVRGREGADPTELTRLLHAALRKIQSRRAQGDISFVVVRKI